MPDRPLVLVTQEDRTAVLTLYRPEKKNAR